MKIKTTKNTKKIIIISTVVIVAAALAIGFFVWKNSNQEQEQDSARENNIATERSESDKEQLENIEKNPDTKNQAPNTDQPAPITKDKETGKQNVSMVSSHDIENGVVYIRGGTNSPVSGGSCAAVLTGPSGQTMQKPTEILINAATIDCKTIAINQSELAKGTWKYKLQYTSTDIEGESRENTFEIR